VYAFPENFLNFLTHKINELMAKHPYTLTGYHHKLGWLLPMVLSMIGAVPTAQANRLETFSYDLKRNRIEFVTESNVQPQGQIIFNPTRLVIDLPGATYKGPTVRRNIGSTVQSVRVSQFNPETTRMVVEFSPDFNSNLLEEQPMKLKSVSPSRWSIQLPSAIATSLQNIASFILPVAGPITAPFGWRIHPITGKRQLHKGIDIGAPMGAPILASADGVVNDTGWDDGGYGNFVELKHADGSLTLYGHASRVVVIKGQQVTQGQLIAEVGSTGRSTGPHLHFEIQPDGKQAADPMAFLPSNNFIILNIASN